MDKNTADLIEQIVSRINDTITLQTRTTVVDDILYRLAMIDSGSEQPKRRRLIDAARAAVNLVYQSYGDELRHLRGRLDNATGVDKSADLPY